MKQLRWGVLVLVVPLSACFTLAPTATINSTTKAFGDVVTTSTEVLATEKRAKPNVRRSEAVMFWIKKGDSTQNIVTADESESFARLTCAGVTSLERSKAFLEYASAYSTALNGITAPGGDSFSGQWKKFIENNKRIELKGPKETKSGKDEFDACAKEVAGQLLFTGAPAADVSDEAVAEVSTSLEAYKALFSALEKAATDSLKAINEIQARKKFSEFVIRQDDSFNAALSQGLGASSLEDAWKRRKAASLWRPYQTFREMIRLNRTTQEREISALAIRMNSELAEYDALRATNSPLEVTKSLAEAQSRLLDLAKNDDLSVSGVISFLQGLQKQLANLKSDFADVNAKAAALNPAEKK